MSNKLHMIPCFPILNLSTSVSLSKLLFSFPTVSMVLFRVSDPWIPIWSYLMWQSLLSPFSINFQWNGRINTGDLTENTVSHMLQSFNGVLLCKAWFNAKNKVLWDMKNFPSLSAIRVLIRALLCNIYVPCTHTSNS